MHTKQSFKSSSMDLKQAKHAACAMTARACSILQAVIMQLLPNCLGDAANSFF